MADCFGNVSLFAATDPITASKFLTPEFMMSEDAPTSFPLSHVYEFGKVTVFYLPSHKLDDPRYFRGTQTARMATHEFMMQRYRAYTHSPSPVKGYWVDLEGQLVHDVMERFEVSFGSESEFQRLIVFLIELCERLNEDAVYVTRGERSFLVNRKPSETSPSENQ